MTSCLRSRMQPTSKYTSPFFKKPSCFPLSQYAHLQSLPTGLPVVVPATSNPAIVAEELPASSTSSLLFSLLLCPALRIFLLFPLVSATPPIFLSTSPYSSLAQQRNIRSLSYTIHPQVQSRVFFKHFVTCFVLVHFAPLLIHAVSETLTADSHSRDPHSKVFRRLLRIRSSDLFLQFKSLLNSLQFLLHFLLAFSAVLIFIQYPPLVVIF